MTIYIIGVVICWLILTADDMRSGHFTPVGNLMLAVFWPAFVALVMVTGLVFIPLMLIALIVHGIPAMWTYYKIMREERKNEG